MSPRQRRIAREILEEQHLLIQERAGLRAKAGDLRLVGLEAQRAFAKEECLRCCAQVRAEHPEIFKAFIGK